MIVDVTTEVNGCTVIVFVPIVVVTVKIGGIAEKVLVEVSVEVEAKKNS
jgi:hypothetical protein